MTTTAERLRTYWEDRAIDRQRIASLAVRYWVVAFAVAVIGLALGLRLWDLGGRAVHHDESIHLKFSWDLFKSFNYDHSPTYHGPFQIFGTAVIFRIFGDSDFTGRLLPALFGTVLVGLPFFLRRYLGWTGVFVAALLLALSPALLYFSRFARNDIYIAVYTLGMAIVVWRYLKEQKEAYLYAVPLLLMLGFVTKEVTFITTGIFLVYLEVQLATDLVDQLRASRRPSAQETVLAYVLLLPTAWLIAALWPLLGGFRRRWSFSTLPPAGHLMVIMGTFALPQFTAAVQKVPEFLGKVPGVGDGLVSGLNIDALEDRHAGPCQENPSSACGFSLHEGEQTLRMVSVFLAIGGSAAIGLLWNRRVWLTGAAIFYIPYFLLFTTLFTNGGDVWNARGDFWQGEGGFWSGIWGSLDYWLLQQFVRRADQPDYYYFILLPVYEFLPLIFALGGALYYAFRGQLEQRLLTGSALLLILAVSLVPSDFPLIGGIRIHLAFLIAIGAVFLLPMDQFIKFLLFWTLAVLYAVTVAGEKMPWITVHLALPLALLAAKVLNDILAPVAERLRIYSQEASAARAQDRGQQRRRDERRAPLDPLMPLILGGSFALAAAAIFQAAGPASGVSVLAWLFSLGALGTVVWAANADSLRAAGQVAAVALFATLLVFTIRAGGTAAFDQGSPESGPEELLIYAQGGPELVTLRDEIDALARTSGRGEDLTIVIDNSDGLNIWPWPWYLRNYHESYQGIDSGFTPEAESVALVGLNNREQVEPYLDKVTFSEEYTHMWWFNPWEYQGLQPASFLGDVLSGDYWSTWRAYFIDRTRPFDPPGPDRIAYFFGAEPIEPIPTQRPETEGVVEQEGQTIIGEPGTEAGQLRQPADMVLDADGNLYVVDTLNHRVQIFDPDGTLVDAFGEAGNGPGQFADPSGPDSDVPSDGPWGIGIDDGGNIYVADTWNHRIQKFGPDREFLLEWGQQVSPEHYEANDPEPFELFGPRDVAIDPDGNVLVVDTGNKRIAKYTSEGGFLASYGSPGSGAGEFNEPSSISVAHNGEIYVADFWNRRIQHFDAEFNFIDEIQVSTWGSQGVTDRAYIIALEDGNVLATDPANGEVLLFDAEGTWQAAWRLLPEGEISRPVGIALGPGGQQLFVADGAASQVRRLALTLLLPAATANGATP